MRTTMTSRPARWAVLAATGALAIATLSGCTGPAGSSGPDGSNGGGSSDAGTDGGNSGQGGDTGTISVTFTSGPHSGTYEGAGSLKCGHGDFVPDGWWIVFASQAEEESADEVNIANFWHAPDSEVDNPDSPYPGEKALFDLWLGNPYLDGAKFQVGSETGGSVALDGADGNTVTFSGTTAEGEAFSVVAKCPVVKTS